MKHSPVRLKLLSGIALCRLRITIFKVGLLLAISSISYGQWADSFGNEWISYDQPYVKIGVQNKGVQRVKRSTLPAAFRTADPDMLQLWHRGKEVAVVKADNENVVFWGLPNDGASDSLLHRPVTARINPYISLYSDEGSYFLTIGKSKGKRAAILEQGGVSIPEPGVTTHLRKEVVTFNDQLSSSTYSVGTTDILLNSYYEAGKTWVGPTIAGPASVTASVSETVFNYRFDTKNLVRNSDVAAPELEIAVTGLRSGSHNVYVYTGANNTTGLREVAVVPFTGFDTRKIKVSLRDTDFSPSGQLFLKMESKTTNTTDWFGVSHLVLSYVQELDMQGEETYHVSVPGSFSKANRIKINNIPPALSEVLEIAEPHTPLVIPVSTTTGVSTEINIPNLDKKGAEIFFSAGKYHEIPVNKIREVDFNAVVFSSRPTPRLSSGAIDPAAFDFLMISNDTLRNGAIQYAQYRSSVEGGRNNTLLVNIRNIYDEFNYGEPSPLAIRRFVAYMLKNGIREGKHNLLLLGHAITYSIRIIKELPEEVPSFGDPGSDILLVAGLNGKREDLAAIPVGRLSAFNEQSLLNYLAKVKTYESDQTESFWKKEVLHLSGGHSSAEIVQLSNILRSLETQVIQSEYGGHVTRRVKLAGVTTNENVDISESINSGVGMLTFFGHGSQSNTDLNFGFVTDANRGYTDTDRYPLMYFNGCGVGNVFTSRTAQGLAGDWLFAPRKGAVVLLGNSYYSYVSPSSKHLGALYQALFSDVRSELSIGQILNKASEAILSSSPTNFDITNIHQVNLLGDPSIKLLRFPEPDFIIEDDGIKIHSESPDKPLSASSKIITRLNLKNGGVYLKDQNIDVEVSLFYKDGSSRVRFLNIDAVAYEDTISFEVDNTGELVRILARVNPEEKIPETLYTNNIAEIIVDWEAAKDQAFFPVQPIRDLISPRLKVFFDNRTIQNGETVRAEPEIMFVVEDDRVLIQDQGLLEVYYRKCEECDLVRVPNNELLPATSPEDDNYTIAFVYNAKEMISGNYELIVIAKDRAGNTLVNPYIITYSIKDSSFPGDNTESSVIASPNPASDYIKFRFPLVEQTGPTSLEVVIYDLHGRERYKALINPTDREWYYFPDKGMNGIYIYRVAAFSDEGKTTLYQHTGKLIINN